MRTFLLASMGKSKFCLPKEKEHQQTFRGSLPSGLAVAVKRVNRSSEIEYSRRNPFTTEFATVVGHLRHKNLVQLRRGSELVLVYEYLPNGSLDKILHKNSSSPSCLTWKRSKLYGQAWLGDFGLAEVYEHSSNTREVTIPPAGRMGYLAPEYVYSAVPTEKTYVYSFGVVVLEVATGRRPVDDDGTVVVDWVWDLREKGKKGRGC
uniref:Protein kinase domain-containing protein n=1 Tax=Salix viminalis TaxID=40686 RepID=A0A6N2NK02_SALVM